MYPKSDSLHERDRDGHVSHRQVLDHEIQIVRDERQIDGLWTTAETQHHETWYQNDVTRRSVPFPLFRPDTRELHRVTIPTELVVQIYHKLDI